MSLPKAFLAAALTIFKEGFPGRGLLSMHHKSWHMLGSLKMFLEWLID